MSLTISTVESLAPDQASLKAASKLLKPVKWPLLCTDQSGSSLIWGECQGSGANPYRVVVDSVDYGYKCTCPSRKFPCKHALALMWMFAEGPSSFGPGEVPDWAHDWVGRRRKTKTKQVATGHQQKNIAIATLEEPKKELDPKAEARRVAAAKKRAAQTRKSIHSATEELDQWIEDQLQAGLAAMQNDLTDRCRQIAARLVDGKAASLAGRIDEMPSRILALPASVRAEGLISELGQLVLLNRAWRANPDAPELHRIVASAETRQDILESKTVLKLDDTWEVLGEVIRTRRDGLVAQSTWLLRLGESDGPRFAQLLDFFPASAGRRSNAHNPGEQFPAEIAYYLGGTPQRAVIVERKAANEERIAWPACPVPDDPLQPYRDAMMQAPWSLSCPVLLGPGRVGKDSAKAHWWCPTASKEEPLPILEKPAALALGSDFSNAVGLWDGYHINMIAGISQWGRVSFV